MLNTPVTTAQLKLLIEKLSNTNNAYMHNNIKPSSQASTVTLLKFEPTYRNFCKYINIMF